MRIHLVAALLVFALAYYFKISQVEFLFLVFAIFSVLVTEMLNTAIEEAVDLATLTKRARAMVAKDIAAASVLVASLNAVIIGLIIFVPRLLAVISSQGPGARVQ
jgi:undecaprenol kinase